MQKYRDLYEVEKQQYEQTLQRYQEDHMDEVEIINLHKRCNNTGTKVDRKTAAKTDTKTAVKAASKAPRSGYHLFLSQQLDEMTGEDRKNYHSIVSRRPKEIKEDPARLFAYNDRSNQMRDDDLLAQQTQKPVIKCPKKAPKTPDFVDTDTKDEEEQGPAVKQPPDFVDTDTQDEEEQEPVVKQPPELIEAEPEGGLGDSYYLNEH